MASLETPGVNLIWIHLLYTINRESIVDEGKALLMKDAVEKDADLTYIC